MKPRKTKTDRKSPKPLTQKQLRFIAEYQIDYNATQAAIRAGYSEKASAKAGFQVLRSTTAQEELARQQKARAEKLAAEGAQTPTERLAHTVENLDRRLFLVALNDPGCIMPDGNARQLNELHVDDRAAIGSAEIILKNAAAGDGIIDRVLKYKFLDPLKATELLYKRLGVMAPEKHEHSGSVDVVEILRQRTERNKRASEGANNNDS